MAERDYSQVNPKADDRLSMAALSHHRIARKNRLCLLKTVEKDVGAVARWQMGNPVIATPNLRWTMRLQDLDSVA
jgi:hypothetical protein